MTREELEEHIPWEAEHHIPFSKDEVEIDHQVLGKQGGQMEVVLVAAKKEVIADYSLAIREAKLPPSGPRRHRLHHPERLRGQLHASSRARPSR